ncbi:hypothetical protein ASE85_09170 [Sphingobium sp. Leaf26]|nr:hypothetical protein ASE85_09170 [Sphingobium sp. Leaf26]
MACFGCDRPQSLGIMSRVRDSAVQAERDQYDNWNGKAQAPVRSDVSLLPHGMKLTIAVRARKSPLVIPGVTRHPAQFLA